MGRISIITVCYNSEHSISRCLNSILEQDCTDIELVIVDGNSSDNTRSIIENFKSKYSNIKYISEEDVGDEVGKFINGIAELN